MSGYLYFPNNLKIIQHHIKDNTFYKQLGSGLSPQGCLNFQGFWGSKCLMVA